MYWFLIFSEKNNVFPPLFFNCSKFHEHFFYTIFGHYPPKEKMPRIIIWHIFGGWSPSEKLYEIKPPLTELSGSEKQKCIFFYRSTALCIGHLREMGVTAVLNAAQGSMTDWNYVNTKAIYYTGVGIQFLGVPAIDLKWYPICNHFQEASDFIEEVVKSKGMLY